MGIIAHDLASIRGAGRSRRPFMSTVLVAWHGHCAEDPLVTASAAGAVELRSAQAEWWVAIRDQQDGICGNTERPAKYADYEVEHRTRVFAGHQN